jgi:predicted secreted hydrolase
MEQGKTRQKVRVRVKVKKGPSLGVKLMSSVLIIGALSTSYWLLTQKPPATANTAPVRLSDEQHYSSERGIVLPADDGVHGARTERWIYRGLLQDQDGKRYMLQLGIQLTEVGLRQTRFYLSLQDLQTGQIINRQQQVTGLASQAGVSGFAFQHEGWKMGGEDRQHLLAIQERGLTLKLQLQDSHDAMIHQLPNSPYPGLLQAQGSARIHLYSRPSMHTQGELTLEGRALRLSGSMWFDHLWGDINGGDEGWTWINLDLGEQGQLLVFDWKGANNTSLLRFASWQQGERLKPLEGDRVGLTPLERPGSWTLRLDQQTWQLQSNTPPIDTELSGQGREQLGLLQVVNIPPGGSGLFETHQARQASPAKPAARP